MDKAFAALANLFVVVPDSIMVGRNHQGRRISPGPLAATSPCLLLPLLPWIIALANHPQFSAFCEILGRTKIMDRQEAFYFYLLQMHQFATLSHFDLKHRFEFRISYFES